MVVAPSPPVHAVLAAALRLALVRGHSWVACTDYRGDVNFFEQDKCLAFPRRWDNRRGATAEIANGHQIAIDTGRDHQPPGACDIAMAAPDWRGGYSAQFPFAVYEQGQVYCLAWPMKNHAAASCTNPFIPDTSLTLLVSSVDPAADPTQLELNGRNINELAGLATNCDPAAPGSREQADECQLGLEKHQSGQADCRGFQRSPKFCFNTDRAAGTGCFRVPGDMDPGHYVAQWNWEFNQNSPYYTCFDFQVVAPGSPEARGGTPGTTGAPDTSVLPCTNNVLRFSAELPPPAATATTARATTTSAAATTALATTSTQDAPATAATTAAPSATSFLATTLTRADGAAAGQCPVRGAGLPEHVSDCFCAFAGADGAGCAQFPDDGSACWCRCCCHLTGACAYRSPGGLQETLALTAASYAASLAATAVGGCSLGMLAMLCLVCCCWMPKASK